MVLSSQLSLDSAIWDLFHFGTKLEKLTKPSWRKEMRKQKKRDKLKDFKLHELMIEKIIKAFKNEKNSAFSKTNFKLYKI